VKINIDLIVLIDLLMEQKVSKWKEFILFLYNNQNLNLPFLLHPQVFFRDVLVKINIDLNKQIDLLIE
jgi:hypothetical protein